MAYNVNGDLSVARRISSNLAYTLPIWKESTDYREGDYVEHLGVLQRCNADHVSLEDFEEAYWSGISGAGSGDTFNLVGNVTGDTQVTNDSGILTLSAGDGVKFVGSDFNDFIVVSSQMTGATSTIQGEAGGAPAPAAGDDNKFLRGDGTWAAAAPEAPAGQEGWYLKGDGTYFDLAGWVNAGISDLSYLGVAIFNSLEGAFFGAGNRIEIHTKYKVTHTHHRINQDLTLTETDGIETDFGNYGQGYGTEFRRRVSMIEVPSGLGPGPIKLWNKQSGASVAGFGLPVQGIPGSRPTEYYPKNPSATCLMVTSDYNNDLYSGRAIFTELGHSGAGSPEMEGQVSTSDGAGGLVPAPLAATADRFFFLKGDGTWSAPKVGAYIGGGQVLDSTGASVNNTTTQEASMLRLGAGPGIQVRHNSGATNGGVPLGPDMLISAIEMNGAVGGTAGSAGAVPAPGAGDGDRFLRGDGSWTTALEGLKVSADGGSVSSPDTEVRPYDTSVLVDIDNLLEIVAGEGVDLYASPAEGTLKITAGGLPAWIQNTDYKVGQMYSYRDTLRGLDTIFRVLNAHNSGAAQITALSNGDVERVQSGPIQAFLKSNAQALMIDFMGEVRVTCNWVTPFAVFLPLPPADLPQFSFCRITIVDMSGFAAQTGAVLSARGGATFADGSTSYPLAKDFGSWICTYHYDAVDNKHYWSVVG